jgi:hypothetical protein
MIPPLSIPGPQPERGWTPVWYSFYDGFTRDEVSAIWGQALRSRQYAQAPKFLHTGLTSSPKIGQYPGEFCAYGVLAHALQLPAKLHTMPNGRIALAYSDALEAPKPPTSTVCAVQNPVYVIDQLPERLLRFLTPASQKYPWIRMSVIREEIPVLYQRILSESGMTSEQMLGLQPTFALLNDNGVSFGTLAQIVESPFWR